MKRVAIYLRVSTDKQTTDNQRRELEGVAARSGWQVIQIYKDEGVSGAKGRDKRPGLDAMMKGVNRKEFDMVAAWSVDRLGRSLTDLLSILQGLHEKGVGTSQCWACSRQSEWHQIGAPSGEAIRGGTNIGAEGQRRRHSQDRQKAWHWHQRRAARFQRGTLAVAIEVILSMLSECSSMRLRPGGSEPSPVSISAS